MKAILVIDEMPKSCDDCVLIYPDKYNDMWCCIACDCVVEENVTAGTLHKWCPLKQLPQKKSAYKFKDFNRLIENAQVEGWNACIDEILGETE